MYRTLQSHFSGFPQVYPTNKEERMFEAASVVISNIEAMKVPVDYPANDDLWLPENDLTWDSYWCDVSDSDDDFETPDAASTSGMTTRSRTYHEEAGLMETAALTVAPKRRKKLTKKQRVARIKRIM